MDPETLLTHRDFVRALARRLVDDENLADDLEQQTWLRALRKPPQGRARAWLGVVARNAARERHRAEERRRSREMRTVERADVPTPEQVLERERVRRRVVEAVLALEPTYRDALLLRYFEDLPVRDVARRLEVPVETARTRLRRGLERLRGRLDREFGGRESRLTALAPLAFPGREALLLGAAKVASGGVFMKAWIGVAAVLALAVGWWMLAEEPTGPGADTADLAGAGAAAAPPGGASARGTAPRSPSSDSDRTFEKGGARGERSVTGEVRDTLGVPIPDAKVYAFGAADSRPFDPRRAAAVRTDASGRFRIAVSEPPLTLFAEADGHSPAVAPRIAPGDHVVLTVGEGRALFGRVTLRDGTPVVGARVRWIGLLDRVAVERDGISDAAGRYRVGDLPDPAAMPAAAMRIEEFWIEATADGLAPLLIEYSPEYGAQAGLVGEARGPSIEWNLVMNAGGVVTGRVLDARTSAPIPGARVVLWSIEGNRTFSGGAAGDAVESPVDARILAETVADPDGAYRFDHAPAEGFHPTASRNASGGRLLVGFVGAHAPGRAFGSAEVFLFPPGHEQTIDLPLPLAGRVRGRVVERDETPVAGTLVSAFAGVQGGAPPWRLDAPKSWARTDPHGRFDIRGVPIASPGDEVTVTARHPLNRMRASVRVALGQGAATAPDLVFDQDVWARIEITDEGGAPIAHARVLSLDGRLLASSGAGGLVRVVPDEEDETRAGEGSRDEYVRIEAAGRAAVVAGPLRYAHGGGPPLRVVLPAETRIAGRVVDARGRAAAYAWIEAWDADLVDVADLAGPPDRKPPRQRLAGDGTPEILACAWGRAEPDGSFVLAGLRPAAYHVVARVDPERPEAEPLVAVAAAVRSPADELAIVLPRALPDPKVAGDLLGDVVDAISGLPVPEFTAILARGEERVPATLVAPGVFFAELEPGAWELAVHSPGHAPWRGQVSVDPGGAPTRVLVRLDGGATARGEVRPPAGQEIASGSITLRHEDGSVRQAELDPAGRFEVRGLQPGVHRISARVRTRSGAEAIARGEPTLVVPEGATDVTAVVDTAASGYIRVRVGDSSTFAMRSLRDEKGRPVRVVLFDEHGERAGGMDHVFLGASERIRAPIGRVRAVLFAGDEELLSEEIEVGPEDASWRVPWPPEE